MLFPNIMISSVMVNVAINPCFTRSFSPRPQSGHASGDERRYRDDRVRF